MIHSIITLAILYKLVISSLVVRKRKKEKFYDPLLYFFFFNENGLVWLLREPPHRVNDTYDATTRPPNNRIISDAVGPPQPRHFHLPPASAETVVNGTFEYTHTFLTARVICVTTLIFTVMNKFKIDEIKYISRKTQFNLNIIFFFMSSSVWALRLISTRAVRSATIKKKNLIWNDKAWN